MDIDLYRLPDFTDVLSIIYIVNALGSCIWLTFWLIVAACGSSIKMWLFHIVNLMPDEHPWPKQCFCNKLCANIVQEFNMHGFIFQQICLAGVCLTTLNLSNKSEWSLGLIAGLLNWTTLFFNWLHQINCQLSASEMIQDTCSTLNVMFRCRQEIIFTQCQICMSHMSRQTF